MISADPTTLPAFVGVDLAGLGYAVVKVNKVIPRSPPPAEAAKQEQARYARAWAAAESASYYELLKDRYKAQINVSKPTAETKPTQ